LICYNTNFVNNKMAVAVWMRQF